MKKMIIAVLTIFALCACSSKSEPVTEVYELVKNNVTMTNTITFEDEKVLNQTIVTVTDLDALGIDEEAVDKVVEDFKKEYDIEGVTYKTVKEGKTLTETITIDYEKTDLEELSAGGIISIPSGKKAAFIGYKETVKELENVGYVKK